MQMPSDREIQERFEDLPHEVQEAIQSTDMARALQDIGRARGLHVDQLGLLEDETLLVMLGFSNPATFEERVAQTLGMSRDDAAAISEELSQELFLPIRAAMRRYMEDRLQRAASREREAANRPRQAMPQAAPEGAAPPAAAPEGAVIAAAGGGKTIMPSSVQPVIHPADELFARPSVALPGATTYSPSKPPITARYASDPYREAIE